jgi:hypothetical protein
MTETSPLLEKQRGHDFHFLQQSTATTVLSNLVAFVVVMNRHNSLRYRHYKWSNFNTKKTDSIKSDMNEAVAEMTSAEFHKSSWKKELSTNLDHQGYPVNKNPVANIKRMHNKQEKQ